jgi:RimJ/RimL family protein N-acetyltransferase
MKIHARTERLILRDWSSSDLDDYARIVSDPEVMKHIGDGKPRPVQYAEDFIETVLRHQATRGWTRFAVEHAKTGRLMGFCGLDDKIGRLDFGWRYARDFWGSGYGYEAAAAALWVSQNTFQLTHITAQSYAENVGSVRIIEKMGMAPIGEGTDFGRPLVIFGFPEEWPDGISGQ